MDLYEVHNWHKIILTQVVTKWKLLHINEIRVTMKIRTVSMSAGKPWLYNDYFTSSKYLVVSFSSSYKFPPLIFSFCLFIYIPHHWIFYFILSIRYFSWFWRYLQYMFPGSLAPLPIIFSLLIDRPLVSCSLLRMIPNTEKSNWMWMWTKTPADRFTFLDQKDPNLTTNIKSVS